MSRGGKHEVEQGGFNDTEPTIVGVRCGCGSMCKGMGDGYSGKRRPVGDTDKR